MKKPTTALRTVGTENGGCKSVQVFSYVVVLCEIGGSEVKAIRSDEYENKVAVLRDIYGNYPGWNVKSINVLYDQDFD